MLALLDGRATSLPDDHPYAAVQAHIQAGIAVGGIQGETDSEDDSVKEGKE